MYNSQYDLTNQKVEDTYTQLVEYDPVAGIAYDGGGNSLNLSSSYSNTSSYSPWSDYSLSSSFASQSISSSWASASISSSYSVNTDTASISVSSSYVVTASYAIPSPSLQFVQVSPTGATAFAYGFTPYEILFQGTYDLGQTWVNMGPTIQSGQITTINLNDGPLWRAAAGDDNDNAMPPYSPIVYMPVPPPD